MSDTATDAFLSGQGIPVDPGQVEAELTRLWGPAAEQVGGPMIDNPNVTRVVLANLVVEVDGANAARIFGTLDEVVARYPSRSIVLGRSREPGRQVAAEVAALCHLPAPGMPQVCSERIILKAGPEALDLLPGAVRPLLEADLPVILWWTGDPRPIEPLFRSLAHEATRIIVDLPDPGADPAALRLALDPAVNAFSRDSAWFGIARWRELIAQFFDGPECHDAISNIRAVTIEAITPAAGPPPRLPIWLAAWLAGQLRWTGVSRQVSSGRIEARFRAKDDNEVDVTIQVKVDPSAKEVGIRAATLHLTDCDGPSSFRLARPEGHSDDLHVEICSDRTCALPRVVVAPDLDPAHRISAGLESARKDEPFRRALPHALWLLS
jgi:glucose-6-phosphate dehydrogenase assembly protein OpcA